MNKKVVGIVAAIIVILIAIGIGIYTLKDKGTEPSTTLEDPITAEDLKPYTNDSLEEIQEQLDTPLTKEQLDTLNQKETLYQHKVEGFLYAQT